MLDNTIAKLDIQGLEEMGWLGRNLLLQKDGRFKCQHCTFEMPYCSRSMNQNKTYCLLTVVIAGSIWLGWILRSVCSAILAKH